MSREIFDGFKLDEAGKRQGRRLLRKFADRKYFGTVTPLLIRIVAENINEVDLLLEAEKMIEWCRDRGHLKRKKSASISRFNNWVRRSKEYRGRNTAVDLERDLEKVIKFNKKYGKGD